MSVIRYVTQDGAGVHDGTSIGDAFTYLEAIAYINGLGVITDHYELYFCGNFTVPNDPGQFTKPFTRQFRMVIRGRNADGTADAVSTLSGPIGGQFGVRELMDFSAATDWVVIRNMRFKDSSAGDLHYGLAARSTNIFVYKCEGDGNRANQFSLTSANRPIMWQCYAHDSSGGADPDTTFQDLINVAQQETGGRMCLECVGSTSGPRDAGAIDGPYYVVRCIGDNCGNGGVQASSGMRRMGGVIACDSVDNNGHGIQTDINSQEINVFLDTLIVGNAGAGVRLRWNVGPAGGHRTHFLHRYGSFGNSSRIVTHNDQPLDLEVDFDDPELTADPFVSRAARNYSLNTAVGGGLNAIETEGIPFLSGLTKSCHCIGALQPKCAAETIVPPGPPPGEGWAVEHLLGTIVYTGRVRKRET